jgi:hypothetical protein
MVGTGVGGGYRRSGEDAQMSAAPCEASFFYSSFLLLTGSTIALPTPPFCFSPHPLSPLAFLAHPSTPPVSCGRRMRRRRRRRRSLLDCQQNFSLSISLSLLLLLLPHDLALQQPVPLPQQLLPLQALFPKAAIVFFFYEIGEFALEATLIGPLDVIIGLLCISQHPGNNHK